MLITIKIDNFHLEKRLFLLILIYEIWPSKIPTFVELPIWQLYRKQTRALLSAHLRQEFQIAFNFFFLLLIFISIGEK